MRYLDFSYGAAIVITLVLMLGLIALALRQILRTVV
jgi:hypothetical protein